MNNNCHIPDLVQLVQGVDIESKLFKISIEKQCILKYCILYYLVKLL